MNIVTLLTQTKAETLRFFELPQHELSRSYGPGKWNIKQLLVHLADAESVLHDRIRRVIAEPKQVIWAFQQDLWCANLDYKNFPLEISKSLYVANRDSILYLAGKFYDTLGTKEFVHNQTGLRTLQNEFDKVAAHNQGHLEHIRQALLTQVIHP